jgi:hypothetical protein
MSNVVKLRSLTAKLETEPGNAVLPELPVLAYGYVRSDERDVGYVTACADLLTAWCSAAEWRLGVVFRDNGYDGRQYHATGASPASSTPCACRKPPTGWSSTTATYPPGRTLLRRWSRKSAGRMQCCACWPTTSRAVRRYDDA